MKIPNITVKQIEADEFGIYFDQELITWEISRTQAETVALRLCRWFERQEHAEHDPDATIEMSKEELETLFEPAPRPNQLANPIKLAHAYRDAVDAKERSRVAETISRLYGLVFPNGQTFWPVSLCNEAELAEDSPWRMTREENAAWRKSDLHIPASFAREEREKTGLVDDE